MRATDRPYAFAQLTARHRRELQVHCYRMLGSFEEAEDMVQETFLRAWRKRETYAFRPLALDVLRIEDGLVAEILSFAPPAFAAFDLPETV